ncbi:hypothetical protein TNCV_4713271 [Trichonephila clavipes]|nr:hypothetical protein TNCV_4713271 [Trichonephila clavipes]
MGLGIKLQKLERGENGERQAHPHQNTSTTRYGMEERFAFHFRETSSVVVKRKVKFNPPLDVRISQMHNKNTFSAASTRIVEISDIKRLIQHEKPREASPETLNRRYLVEPSQYRRHCL